jgi:peptide/nickel transport system permease protein
MFYFIAHRLLTSILVLFLVSVVVFVSIRLSPGDPALLMLGADSADLVVGNAPGSDYQKSAFEARLQALRHEMGLDQPLYLQYLFWLQGILKGNLGYSVRNQLPVLPLILDRLPASLELLVFATVLATLIAIPAGIWSAVRHRSIQDYVTTTLAASGLAIPVFWLGLLLIQVFSVQLGWLPPSGYVPLWENPVENLRRAILPSLTLGVYLAAMFVRFLRADMLEVLQQDYIRTAYAKGLHLRQVIFNHALKNALISVLTVMGVAVGGLLSGAVLIEQVFGWSGLGWLVVQAIFNRDYPIVQGVVLLSALGFTLVNMLVDISYGLLNPRIRA